MPEFWGDMKRLREGLYESLLTSGLGNQLAASVDLEPEIRPVDVAEQAEVLARHVRDAAFRALASQRDPAKRVKLVNAVLRFWSRSTTRRPMTRGSCSPS